MMGQLISQADAGAFVHAAKEMEISVYTLRELASELRSKAENVPITAAMQEVNSCALRAQEEKDYIASLESSIEEAKAEQPPKRKKFPVAEKIAAYFGWWFSCMKKSISVLFKGKNSNDPLAQIFLYLRLPHVIFLTIVIAITFPVLAVAFFVFYLLYLPFAAIQHVKKEKKYIEDFPKRNKERVQNLVYALSSRQRELANRNDRLSNAREQLSSTQYMAQCLRDQANDAETKAQQINTYLQECYRTTGIVGPDYRHIDCMIVFDYVFRNDLADTIREAVFYYEEKKFRTMVVRGIDSVHQMLGSMANSLMDVRTVLDGISNDVTSLGDSFDRQMKTYRGIESGQKKLLEETQAARYAADKYYAAQEMHNAYVQRKFL